MAATTVETACLVRAAGDLIQVRAGGDLSRALDAAGCLLSAASDLAVRLAEADSGADNGLWCLVYLMDAAAGLVGSVNAGLLGGAA